VVFANRLAHMPLLQQSADSFRGSCLVTAWAALAVPDYGLAALRTDLFSVHFGLAVLLFPCANFAALGVPVVVVNPIGCSKHHRPLLLDFVIHHNAIQRLIESIQVAQQLVAGLWGQVAARPGTAAPSLCSMLVRLGTDGYHLLYRRHSRREGDSVV
jgi:hypothetical protein